MTTTEAVALRALSMVDMAAASTPEMTTPATPALHHLLSTHGEAGEDVVW